MSFQHASIFPSQFVDSNGSPLVGGTISAYVAGTTTPANMYTDSSGTSAGSIITLNARGEPEVSGATIVIWLDTLVTYKFVLKTSQGVSVWTADNISTNADGIVTTVADMVANEGLGVGFLVRTAGYYADGDGGANTYRIVAGATGTADGGRYIDLANGLQAKGLFLNGEVNLKQFGTTGATDAAAIDAATAAFEKVSMQTGETAVYETGFASTPSMTITGLSPIQTTDSGVARNRGNTFVAVHEPLANVAAENTPTKAFDGDFPSPHTYQYVITGTDTAGDPAFSASGEGEYTTLFELSGQRHQGYFASGKNVASFTTGGRTGWNMDTRHISHAGKGDAWQARWDVFMNTQDPDILMMRGVPASGLLIGTVRTAQPNVIMQNIEMNLNDEGFSSTGKALTFGLSRTAADNGKDQHWWLMRGISKGSEPIDAGLQLTGDWRNGIDLSVADTIQRAIALKADQSIYFNTTVKDIKGAPQWVTSTPYVIGDYCYNDNNIYEATSAGTSGGTPPTHLTGTVSDGGVDWLHIVLQDFKGYADADDGTRIYWDSASSSLKVDVGGSTLLAVNSTVISAPVLPTHADEAAAITAGRVTGDIYQTATGELRIKL